METPAGEHAVQALVGVAVVAGVGIVILIGREGIVLLEPVNATM